MQVFNYTQWVLFCLGTPQCDHECDRRWFEWTIVKKIKKCCVFEWDLYEAPCFLNFFYNRPLESATVTLVVTLGGPQTEKYHFLNIEAF